MGIRELYQFVSKGKMEPFYSSQFFFRYISVVCSFFFIKIKLSSNSVTFISLLCAVVGGLLLAAREPDLLILSIVLMNLYNILDHCDGEVARYEVQILKKKKGPEGPFFDAIVHYLFTPVLFFSLALQSYHVTHQFLDLWAGLISIIWLSSFGQAAALRVSLDYVFAGKGDLDSIKSIWSHDKVVHSDRLQRKDILRKLIREVFSTQGQILVVSIAVISDLFIATRLAFRFSSLVLYSYGIIAVFGIPRSLISFFTRLNMLSK